MTDRDDDLVECDDCGRKGLPARIERTDCPHFTGAAAAFRGP